jgi:phage terminase large subunit-like protein
LIESLASLTETERNECFALLGPSDWETLDYVWALHARPEQIMPPGDWTNWLILAGRGFGKTRTGAETVRQLVCGDKPEESGQYRRIALVAETAADARDVMVEGDSGILGVHPPAFRPTYEPSKRRLTWPNGAVATLFNATEPNQLRGPQFDLVFPV